MSQTEFTQLSEQIKALTTLTSAQFMNVNERLDKINGKVARHDDAITQSLIERSNLQHKTSEQDTCIDEIYDRLADVEKKEANHVLACPNVNKIRALEDNQLETKSVKKWIVGSVATTGIVMSILWILFQIYFKTHGL